MKEKFKSWKQILEEKKKQEKEQMKKRPWIKTNPKEKIKRKKNERKEKLKKKQIWKQITKNWANDKKLGKTSFTYLIISCGWKHEKISQL